MATYIAVFGAITAVARPPLSVRRTVARARGVGGDGIPARHHLIGGFPWIPLGNTMVTLLPIAQLASVVGVLRAVAVRRVAECRLRGGRDLDRPAAATIAAGAHDRC